MAESQEARRIADNIMQWEDPDHDDLDLVTLARAYRKLLTEQAELREALRFGLDFVEDVELSPAVFPHIPKTVCVTRTVKAWRRMKDDYEALAAPVEAEAPERGER